MKNSLQGNLGFGKAIEYFTSQGITISIPLNDTQKYDLVADFNGKLQRIQIKTSRYSENEGTYQVLLKQAGGTGNKITYFDNTSCDYVFIYTLNDKMYLIPSDKITAKSNITVGKKYIEYEIYSNNFQNFINKNLE